MTDKETAFLDELFDSARSDNPTPSDELRVRVMADAIAAVSADHFPAPTGSIWQSFIDMLGGWPALGGVAAAGVTGLWLGLAPPAAVETLAADVLGNTTSVSFVSGFDDLVGEGVIDG